MTSVPRPHLHLHATSVFVRDLDRSLAFFVGSLGFGCITNRDTQPKQPWVAVIPPDGTALLSLVQPSTDEEARKVGQSTPIVFITDDIQAQYEAWAAAGVPFLHAPQLAEWGGVFTYFHDVDGNRFLLASVDPMTRQLHAERLAIAQRAEAERRAAHERTIARDVQARLFPQSPPASSALTMAGACLQARDVGGDYFDYLSLGDGRLGLIVADIAGKGMPAALLMAHLQASVRSLAVSAAQDPLQFLGAVHARFWEATPPQAYATLFFAEFDERTKRIRYANCGHPPGLLWRDGRCQRLASTSTVLGLFESWSGQLEERQLQPGDLLVVHSDGVGDALDAQGEEYGDLRLEACVARHLGDDVDTLVQAVIGDVRAFGVETQTDDITVLAARVL
ncbi:MAG TPA: SpoIIE family protein phosphatase [Luteitalea sp.]|nr:SpoIIE family protein phosphatase [Luteitalea sp.]